MSTSNSVVIVVSIVLSKSLKVSDSKSLVETGVCTNIKRNRHVVSACSGYLPTWRLFLKATWHRYFYLSRVDLYMTSVPNTIRDLHFWRLRSKCAMGFIRQRIPKFNKSAQRLEDVVGIDKFPMAADGLLKLSNGERGWYWVGFLGLFSASRQQSWLFIYSSCDHGLGSWWFEIHDHTFYSRSWFTLQM